MANIDWLKGNNFHSVIRNEVKKIERATGVDFSDHGIDYLIELFEENKKSIYLFESEKPSFQQRSIDNASESVRIMLNSAVRHARDERNSDFIRRDDLQEAYRINYCGVWPLCKGTL